MTNAVKGALLSGLVLPGLGQIVLKHHKRGLALVAVVLSGLTVMVFKAVQLALSVLAKIDLERGAAGMQAITQAAAQASASSDSRLFNACLLLIIGCWIFSVADAYMIGKRMDRMPAKN